MKQYPSRKFVKERLSLVDIAYLDIQDFLYDLIEFPNDAIKSLMHDEAIRLGINYATQLADLKRQEKAQSIVQRSMFDETEKTATDFVNFYLKQKKSRGERLKIQIEDIYECASIIDGACIKALLGAIGVNSEPIVVTRGQVEKDIHRIL